LKERLINRGKDKEKDINQRLQNAAKEMKAANFYDYRVINTDLEESIAQVYNIISHEVSLK